MSTQITTRPRCAGSTVFPVEQVPHGIAASGILFAIVGGQRTFGRVIMLGLAAIRAAVGKTGLARLQFELFSANDTGFNGIGHSHCVSGNLCPALSTILQKKKSRFVSVLTGRW